MSAITDPRGRTVLDESEIDLLAIFVSVLRKHNDPNELQNDIEDVRVVLNALTITGYAVVPQGVVDAVRKLWFENRLSVG